MSEAAADTAEHPPLNALITLAIAARKVPPKGVAPGTVWRWARIGVKHGDRVVRLRTWATGRRLLTTERALVEFFAEVAVAEREAEEGDAAE